MMVEQKDAHKFDRNWFRDRLKSKDQTILHYENALAESKARQRELEEKLHEYQAEKRRKKVINATLATAVGIWLLVKSPLNK